jgi:2,3-bisphosphoglycerate-independent phosphoglycerate mutase
MSSQMNVAKNRPLALIILDGWGYSRSIDGNAISLAHTPHYDEICRRYPAATLAAAGALVGQREGESGNAEVGHLNIGTGRIARTEVSKIEDAVASGSFMENPVLNRAFSKALEADSAVHLIGLLSDAGVHSSTNNLYAIIRLAKHRGLSKVFVHGILDGVDGPPRTADVHVEALEIKLADIGIGKIATLCGRFFAMDSGENWERTARAYTMLVHAEGERSSDAVASIRNSFLRGITDEFVSPIILENAGNEPVATIKNGDLVVYFNHRPETMRQLVRSLSIADESMIAKPIVDTVCLTEYDSGFNLPVAFRPEIEKNVLADMISAAAIPNFRITESARFPHLTDLFDGGTESTRHFERHLLVGSSSAGESCPESHSFKITDKVLRSIESCENGVFIVNLPAADIVAESGDLAKTIAAIQFIDTCIGGICETARQHDGVVIITSTHGNCEEMLVHDSDEPAYSTTSNPVPIHFIDDRADGLGLRQDGSLQDIAPTILAVLGINKPEEMTGSDLRLL